MACPRGFLHAALVHLSLFVVPVCAFRTALKESQRRAADIAVEQAEPVDGFIVKPSSACTSRTVSRGKLAAADCAKQCMVHPTCQCFSMVGKHCRIAAAAGKGIKSSKSEIAYLQEQDITVECPVDAPNLEALPGRCAGAKAVQKAGECSQYFEYGSAGWAEKTCPKGLSFSSVLHRCTVASDVDGCKEATVFKLRESGCQRRPLLLASGADAQEWIDMEADQWAKAYASDPLHATRAEGRAARSILRTAQISISSNPSANHTSTTTSRWAGFTRKENVGLIMQALALVALTPEASGIEIDVMAIVSRNSLLKDEFAEPGSGRALLASILEAIHEQHPEKGMRIVGTPGDDFVKKLYLKNGMKVIGMMETGMPKLALDVPADCFPFYHDAVLCQELKYSDYAKIAWRLFPFSGYIVDTCAHLVPSAVYIEQVMR